MRIKRMIRVDLLVLVVLLGSVFFMSVKEQNNRVEYEYANVFVNEQLIGASYVLVSFNKEVNDLLRKEKYMNFDAAFEKMGNAGWEYKGPLQQLDGTPGLVFMREK